MYAMADLSRRDEPATGSDRDSETPLCTVTYDKARKLLTVDPDFIGDDGLYGVTNSQGIKFNYRIEHVSEEQTPLELQQQREDTQRVSIRSRRRTTSARRRAFRTGASPRSHRRREAGLFVENALGDPGARRARLFALRRGYIYIRRPPPR